LILLIVLGDAVQQGLTQDNYSVTGALIVITVFALLQVFVSFMHFQLPRLRPVLEAYPVVLVEDGKVIERNLKRERLTLPELMEKARGEQLESLDDVKWAVLETSGSISFIPESDS
jgi:uncharacterized membrane protein YcaP (DUF421 family)